MELLSLLSSVTALFLQLFLHNLHSDPVVRVNTAYTCSRLVRLHLEWFRSICHHGLQKHLWLCWLAATLAWRHNMLKSFY